MGSGLLKYIFKRIIFMIPTFLGITLLSFVIINLAPGGPIEQKLQSIRFSGSLGESGLTRSGHDIGVSQEVLEALKKQYGFDKPLLERYLIWLRNIVHLDFGNSFSYEEPVIDVIVSKFPVSMQFGFASFFLTYLVCIPLGIAKAVKAGSRFDGASSLVLYLMYSVPTLVLGIFLIVIFAGEGHLNWFPIGGLKSDSYDDLSLTMQIWDRIYHFVLPVMCYVFGGFTSLTMLMRSSMLDVLGQDYVRTARAKGLTEGKVIYKHALRNALIPIATGLGGFFGVFLSGSVIVERIFQLDGMGLLGYNSILSRDFNVIMALIFLSSVVLMLGRLVSDILYVIIDPRIDFS